MSHNVLKGKKGIIFGALNDQSIAWKVAEAAHAEGAEFVLTNAPIAMRMGEINGLAAKTGSQIIPADATNLADLENLVEKAMEILRGKLYNLKEAEQKKNHEGFAVSKNSTAEWGSQIRSYVLHPYKMVKDHRINFESSDVIGILNGELDDLITELNK
jgi:enoyl-[acyl-carrier-protein] reductase (NADH)